MANNVIQVVLQLKDSASQALARFNKSLDLTGAKIAGFGIGAVTIGAAFAKVKHEMSDASDASARLAAAFKANGGAAGVSERALTGYAEQLQRTSTFSDEAVKRGEALLLQFTNIRGEVFRLADQAMVDLAAKMGGDVAGAAQLLGKALQEPARGMDALRRAGVVLSDAQRASIKQFVELGDVASAQRVILAQVERQAGGTAAALRNTLPGALQSVENAFNDLFEGTPEQVEKVTKSILSIADALEDPEFKAAVQHQVGLIAELAAAWLNAGIAAEKYSDKALKAGLGARDEALEKTRQLLNEISSLGGHLKIDGKAPLLGNATVGVLSDPGDLRQSPSTRAISHSVQAAKDALVQLDEIRVGVDEKTHTVLQRLSEFANDWDRQLAGWNDDTRTELEKQIGDFDEFVAKLDAVFDAGLISAEQFNARLKEAFQKATPKPDFKLDELIDTDDAEKKLNEFATQAARNIQDAFANALGGRGRGNFFGQILDAFKQMFAQIEAQALLSALHIEDIMKNAAKAMQGIFGGGNNPLGGVLGTVFGAVGSLFGFAGGTQYAPGGIATVGEGGPEKVLLPRGSKVISAARTRREAAGNGGSARPVNIKIENTYSGLGLPADQVAALVANAQRAQSGALAQLFQDNGVPLR